MLGFVTAYVTNFGRTHPSESGGGSFRKSLDGYFLFILGIDELDIKVGWRYTSDRWWQGTELTSDVAEKSTRCLEGDSFESLMRNNWDCGKEICESSNLDGPPL